jgi:hypothetical protein
VKRYQREAELVRVDFSAVKYRMEQTMRDVLGARSDSDAVIGLRATVQVVRSCVNGKFPMGIDRQPNGEIWAHWMEIFLDDEPCTHVPRRLVDWLVSVVCDSRVPCKPIYALMRESLAEFLTDLSNAPAVQAVG